MTITIELPTDVATEVYQDGQGEILEFRSAGADAIAAAFACVNVGATTITLLQGPQTFHYVAERLLGWQHRRKANFSLTFRGPNARGELTIGPEVDVAAVVSFLLSMIEDQ